MSRVKQIDRIVALETGLGDIKALLTQLVSNQTVEGADELANFNTQPKRKNAANDTQDRFEKSANMPLSYKQWRVLNIARWAAAKVMADPADAELLDNLDTYKYPVVQKDAREAIQFAFVVRAAGKGATIAQHREMARLLLALHRVGMERKQGGK